jgi:hypothetical protein
MPNHDWTLVDAGIFHAFHHDWITELARVLNQGLLPPDYYALPEQYAAGFGPDILALQEEGDDNTAPLASAPPGSVGTTQLSAPEMQPIAETDLTFYRRKQMSIAIRHVSGDRLVAMVEIVSPGNKAARNPLRAIVQKATELLVHEIHLLLFDLFPPGKRDPEGIHNEIWQEIAGKEYELPRDKPLTLASYESGNTIRAYVHHVAVGDALCDMPLFFGAWQES